MLLLNASQSLLYLHSFVLAPFLPPPPHSPAVAASTRPMRTSTFDIHLNLHYFLSLYISLLLLLFTVIPILISTALCMGFFPLPLSLSFCLSLFPPPSSVLLVVLYLVLNCASASASALSLSSSFQLLLLPAACPGTRTGSISLGSSATSSPSLSLFPLSFDAVAPLERISRVKLWKSILIGIKIAVIFSAFVAGFYSCSSCCICCCCLCILIL